jgi:hypothetical protein
METVSGQDQRRFRLGDGERVPDGLRRIARGQLDMSIERLNGDTDEDLGTAVHETRKSLKRLRATVRLARDELGVEVYRRENVAFRDAGRRLGGARDSQVLLETLDALTDRYPDEARHERFERFKRTLVGQHGAAQRRLRDGVAVAEVLGELRRARARVGDWQLEPEGVDALAPGFKRIYRRGRRAYRAACQEPSTENLHELRKRAKYLWYAASALAPAGRSLGTILERPWQLASHACFRRSMQAPTLRCGTRLSFVQLSSERCIDRRPTHCSLRRRAAAWTWLALVVSCECLAESSRNERSSRKA